MGTEPHPLTVVRSPAVTQELGDIWRWNAGRYGVGHADAYLRLLNDRIESLSTDHHVGQRVTGRPDLRYVRIQRRNRGHGHVLVYSVESRVVLLHVFHTAQDWPTKLINSTTDP